MLNSLEAGSCQGADFGGWGGASLLGGGGGGATSRDGGGTGDGAVTKQDRKIKKIYFKILISLKALKTDRFASLKVKHSSIHVHVGIENPCLYIFYFVILVLL